jgi:hypothetical protein
LMGQHQQQFMGNSTSIPQQQHQPPMMNNQTPQFVPNNPISQSQVSIDILGLADKAASAIQALGASKLNQPLSQGQYPPPQMGGPSPQQQQGYQLPYNASGNPMMGQQPNMTMQPRPAQSSYSPHQMYSAPPQQQQQPQPFGAPGPNIMNQQQQQQGARKRTTASFNELPVSVQYALQVRQTI